MKCLFKTIVFFLFSVTQVFAQADKPESFTGCATDALMNKNELLMEAQERLNKSAYDYFMSGTSTNARSTNSIAYIPVVVHIIHNGGSENISDAQVQTAISHLNQNYNQSNNYQIQFCLAQRDPNGNSTNGITRDISSLTTETMEFDDIALQDINRWA